MPTNGDKVTENGGENTKKIVDLNTTELDHTDDIVDEGLSSESVDVSGEKKDGGESKVIGSDSADDIQKNIKRAESFGVSVTLTEEEKRNSRVEMFGTVAAVNGSGGVKKAGETKKAEDES